MPRTKQRTTEKKLSIAPAITLLESTKRLTIEGYDDWLKISKEKSHSEKLREGAKILAEREKQFAASLTAAISILRAAQKGRKAK